ncbi:hypothetical protein UA08_05918 [Talaromyces atroroseus]|uniref:Homeobox domain-containing protein n=1 Tax=Talaromyces atroroseus TaxID=1441469 RepID=A0A225APK1_TALAT|nr:hypothetical protein UA08_05918 [Talaromyces atroroseus]OKL59208.1 hypothetical protein UA08_05918 [Talaromyces atroroseus]
MSRQQPQDSDHDMAVTYTSSSNYAAPGQTLPSFRELLPQHLHEEIDRTSYSHSHSHSRDRDRDRDRDRHRTPDAYKSRPGLPFPAPSGPSQILPPLRDLSGRAPERPMSAYAYDYDDASLTRSRSRGGYTREHAYTSHTTASTDDDRYRYSGGAMYGNQNAYDPARYAGSQQPAYPASTSSTGSSTEYMTHTHALPPSNFGVIGMGAGDALDSRGKRRRGNLPKPVTDVLRAWFHEHLDHPYPTEEDKQVFMNQTGLSISQISNWFINARRRQLPALRNQLRNSDGEHGHMRGASPLSDGDVSSMSSSPTRTRHR